MPRKYEPSIEDKKNMSEAEKTAMRDKSRAFRLKIRQDLATKQNLTLEEKVDLIVDYIVGGEL